VQRLHLVSAVKKLLDCVCDADGIMHDPDCPCWREVSIRDVILVGGKSIINTGEGGVWHRAIWGNGQRSGCDCTVGHDHPIAEVRIRFEIEEPSWD
jgi:hypothetical protein